MEAGLELQELVDAHELNGAGLRMIEVDHDGNRKAAGAGRDLLQGDIPSRGCAARNGVSVPPKQVERRHTDQACEWTVSIQGAGHASPGTPGVNNGVS